MMRILESREIPLISLNMETGDDQDETDDLKAIIRDYVKRRSASSVIR